jgi:Ankyrin repeats (3 copies)
VSVCTVAVLVFFALMRIPSLALLFSSFAFVSPRVAVLAYSLGVCPLFAAACNGFDDCCRILLDADADKNCQDSEGHTALLAAVANSHVDVIQMLLEAGADPTIQDISRFLERGVVCMARVGEVDNSTACEILREVER